MVEDSEDACVLIAAETERHGYAPQWRRVSKRRAAMREALAQQEWDVIVADYVVPGFDALASLKVAQELGPRSAVHRCLGKPAVKKWPSPS